MPISVRIGTMEIVFEETSLSQIQRTLGGASYEHGSGGEHTYNLCYRLRAGTDSMHVVIGASVMGGPAHSVGFLELRQMRDVSGIGRPCHPIPGSVRVEVNGHEAAPGLSVGELSARFGNSPIQLGDTLRFEWQATVRDSRPGSMSKGPEEGDAQVSTTLDAVIQGGRVITIVLYRVTTT